MSVATVKTHVSRILAELDLDNRVQMALLAHDAGLLDEDDRAWEPTASGPGGIGVQRHRGPGHFGDTSCVDVSGGSLSCSVGSFVLRRER